MSTQQFRPLKNLVDRWLGPLKTLKPTIISKPLPQPKTMQQPIHPNTPADKAANVGNIKTYGSGREPQGTVYNNMPISKERIQQAIQEAENEAAAHEKEISAPIKSYYQGVRTEFGAAAGGFGLLDPTFVARNEAFTREQQALVADRNIDEILPNARGTSPIKTFQN